MEIGPKSFYLVSRNSYGCRRSRDWRCGISPGVCVILMSPGLTFHYVPVVCLITKTVKLLVRPHTNTESFFLFVGKQGKCVIDMRVGIYF